IREGLVVTPSKIPRSFASLICARSAVSMKNFIKCRFFYRYNMITRWERGEIKNGKVTYIAPLRPPTVAAFRPWRGSAGAGRIRLCRCKDNKNHPTPNNFLPHPPVSPAEAPALASPLFPRLAVEPRNSDQIIPPAQRTMIINQDHIIVRRLHVIPFRQRKRGLPVRIIPIHRDITKTIIPHLQQEPALITAIVGIEGHFGRIGQHAAGKP